jgi:hypothetical protein
MRPSWAGIATPPQFADQRTPIVNLPASVTNALLLVASVAIGLAVLELTVRLFVPVRNVGPSFTVYDPEYGQRLKRSFSATRYTPEFTMSFSTNSLGFRGPETREPPRDVILFLGDSFTLGYGVSDGEEYPAIVRDTLRKRRVAVAVLNAGIGDSGNGRWVKFLRHEAARYEPRLVVLQVHPNDFDDNLRERLFELTPTGDLRELPVPPPGLARRLQTLIEAVPGLPYSHLVGLLRELPALRASRSRETDRSGTDADGARKEASYRDRLTLRLIAESLRICARNSWPALGLLAGFDPDRVGLLEHLFAGLGADVVAVPSKDAMPGLYYTIDGHWRLAGHELAARRLLEKLGPYLDRGS